jgi:hypothetical protein
MRLFLALVALSACASAASAQISHEAIARDMDLQAQQQMQRQRSIALENQLNALDARVQSEQRLRDVEATRPPAFYRPTDPATPRPVTAGGGYASIPDAALAASNARVRAASQNRR